MRRALFLPLLGIGSSLAAQPATIKVEATSSAAQVDNKTQTEDVKFQTERYDRMLERTVAWYRAFYDQGRVISNEQLDAYEAALA